MNFTEAYEQMKKGKVVKRLCFKESKMFRILKFYPESCSFWMSTYGGAGVYTTIIYDDLEATDWEIVE